MKLSLRNQVHDYLHGKNGLAHHGPYTFFQPTQAAKNTIRSLFLAHNQAVGAGVEDGTFLDDELEPDDDDTAVEYEAGHSHDEELNSDAPVDDDLAQTLAES